MSQVEEEPVFSPGESTQPIYSGKRVRSSTRVRRRNVTLDTEGVREERMRLLRNRRRGILSSITAKRREIDNLLNDVNNLDPVRVKLAELTQFFQNFVDAQNAYHSQLEDEARKEESNAFFDEIEASLNFFCDTVNHWLLVTEVKLNDANITPDDSVSQVIPRDLHQRESCYVSGFSRASKASSISTARVKEAAKIAEIQAEAQALR